MDNVYDVFQKFMITYDLYPKPIPGYRNVFINRIGCVYDMFGNKIQPYLYRDGEHYDSLYVRDMDNKPHVIGIHQAIAMTFNPNYYPGCIVHHKDENKYHNWDTNLEVTSRSAHGFHHHPNKYQPIPAYCQVCGRVFMWGAEEQRRYYADLHRGKPRIISCSRSCSSFYGRMTQLGRNY